MSEIINPKDGFRTAQQIVGEQFTHEGVKTLVAREKTWYAWHKGRYVELSDTELDRLIYPWLANKKILKKTKGSSVELDVEPNKRMVEDLRHAMRALCSKGEVQDFTYMGKDANFPNTKNLVPFQNGLLDVEKYIKGDLELIPHTPLLFNLNCLNRDFEEEAACPNWVAFLDEIFDGDGESIQALQEWFGYNLTADTSQQKMHLWQGEKRGGKGTCSRVLAAMIGTENVAWPTIDSLGTPFGLEPLIGRKAAIFADAGLGRWTDGKQVGNIIKNITGEDSLYVNRKGKTILGSVKVNCKLTMLVNETPKLSDASNALGSRPIFVYFPNSYLGREDRTLEGRLLAELPGITLWALEGLKRLRQTGLLLQPASGITLKEEFEEGSSNILAFTRDCCQIGPGKQIDTEVIYKRYRGWCEEQGYKNLSDNRHFGIQLRSIDGRIRRDRHSAGDRKRFYSNIDLNPYDRKLVTQGVSIMAVNESDQEHVLKFMKDRKNKKRTG